MGDVLRRKGSNKVGGRQYGVKAWTGLNGVQARLQCSALRIACKARDILTGLLTILVRFAVKTVTWMRVQIVTRCCGYTAYKNVVVLGL